MLSVILPIFYEQWQDQILLTDTYSLDIRSVQSHGDFTSTHAFAKE